MATWIKIAIVTAVFHLCPIGFKIISDSDDELPPILVHSTDEEELPSAIVALGDATLLHQLHPIDEAADTEDVPDAVLDGSSDAELPPPYSKCPSPKRSSDRKRKLSHRRPNETSWSKPCCAKNCVGGTETSRT